MQRAKPTISTYLVLVLLVVLATTTLIPLLFMLMTSLKDYTEYLRNPLGFPNRVNWGNFKSMLVTFNLIRPLWNSIYINSLAGLCTTFLSALAAYSFSKVPFRGSRGAFLIILSLMMIPYQIIIIPLYRMFSGLRLINNSLSLIISYTVICLPYTIYFLERSFRSIPDEVTQSARIDGAGYYTVFWSIIVPMGITAVISVTLLNFVWTWKELFLGMMFLQKTLLRTLTVSVGTVVADRFRMDVPLLMTGLLLNTVPIALIYLFMQRYFIEGLSVGALK